MLSIWPSTSAIKDYAAIGDCRSIALVSKHGSIDWLCWPRFDSPSIFAALVDREKGGFWSITPQGEFRVSRAYVEDSNILQTHFETTDAKATLTDLMPVASEEYKQQALVPDHELVRRLECTHGIIEAEVMFHPRADYGATPVTIRDLGRLGIRMDVGGGSYWLRSNAPVNIAGDHVQASVNLQRGDVLEFSFSYAQESPAVLPLLGDALGERIRRSMDWWQTWAAGCAYSGPYRKNVTRSALALKLLTYPPSGAIAAAGTTSLPEIPGGDSNWDYRYCWLRDASLTIRSMLGLGYREEAESFLNWLLHATRITQPRLKPLYDVYGNVAPRERELCYLSGYAGSRPVRVGNGARDQLQLDVYGEVIDAAAQFVQHGGELDRTTQKVLIGFGKEVAKTWHLPDESIWEPRSGRQHRTYSRLLCWTALDRLLELSKAGAIAGAPVDSFARERKRIEEEFQLRAWNPKLESYVAVLDGDELDASLLLIPWHGFEAADSYRMRRTYQQTCEQLGLEGCLLYRYRREPPEGAFGVCSFWAAEYLALGGGTIEQAREQFECALNHQNDLGLFSEEVCPPSGDALGNFPQAFTHVGVISAALALEERAAANGRSGAKQ